MGRRDRAAGHRLPVPAEPADHRTKHRRVAQGDEIRIRRDVEADTEIGQKAERAQGFRGVTHPHGE
jgi:hypothetical protein